jgi:hypothetical protein
MGGGGGVSQMLTTILLSVIFQFSDLHTQISLLITETHSLVNNCMLLVMHTSHLLLTLALMKKAVISPLKSMISLSFSNKSL